MLQPNREQKKWVSLFTKKSCELDGMDQNLSTLLIKHEQHKHNQEMKLDQYHIFSYQTT